METLVRVIMGSRSDWKTMANAVEILETLGIPHDVRILSAHRTPEALVDYIRKSETEGTEVFIAAAGGAAHLAGVIAGHTTLPVLGVPMESPALKGLDSLLSTVQMPAGIPVATFAIGKAGAVNSALFAAALLGLARDEIAEALKQYRKSRSEKVLADPDPRLEPPT
ncbi:MAG: 5-(carboxyamino)imidazole ribonucleotide mutase [Acidobacteriota bacterium]